MLFRLFVAFAIIPVIELYLLVEIGSKIGALNTIAIVLLTAFVGAWLARQQGAQTMFKIRNSLNQGAVPAEEMIDGFLILMAGLVLLTPGFLTDCMGLLLLFPPSRVAFKRWVRKKLDKMVTNKSVTITTFHG